ncbi:hypothetical protein ACIBBD_35175 [Streptomyces sp. NPDC051315]
MAFRTEPAPLPFVPPLAWTIDEAARRYILFHLTEGQGARVEIRDTDRPA